MLEATGRLQKCRLYQMSDNKAHKATSIPKGCASIPIIFSIIYKSRRYR